MPVQTFANIGQMEAYNGARDNLMLLAESVVRQFRGASVSLHMDDSVARISVETPVTIDIDPADFGLAVARDSALPRHEDGRRLIVFQPVVR